MTVKNLSKEEYVKLIGFFELIKMAKKQFDIEHK